MKVPRDLSGSQLIKVLCRDWGYRQVHQEGSHVILQTETPAPNGCQFPTTIRSGWGRSMASFEQSRRTKAWTVNLF